PESRSEPMTARSADLNDALPQPPICASRPNRPFLTSKYALFLTAANSMGEFLSRYPLGSRTTGRWTA
ncbi:MAG: hypothetical protein OXE53_03435, partial [Deltaproteobacteria bacterium]|nr:hypothetical protein [Deltaproteobacteria bacterium]